MLLHSRTIPSGLALVLAWQLAACANAPTGLPNEAATPFRSATPIPATSDAGNVRIVACPPSSKGEAIAVIGPAGGILELGPHVLHVPPHTVQQATLFRMIMPPGGRLILREELGDPHAALTRPVALTISYGRCPRQDRLRRAIRVVTLEASGFQELEPDMVEHDESAGAFTIRTTRFSTFAVAY